MLLAPFKKRRYAFSKATVTWSLSSFLRMTTIRPVPTYGPRQSWLSIGPLLARDDRGGICRKQTSPIPRSDTTFMKRRNYKSFPNPNLPKRKCTMDSWSKVRHCWYPASKNWPIAVSATYLYFPLLKGLLIWTHGCALCLADKNYSCLENVKNSGWNWCKIRFHLVISSNRKYLKKIG